MSNTIIVDGKGTEREVSRDTFRGNIEYVVPTKEPRTFEEWQGVMSSRQKERKELQPFVSKAEVKIDIDRPIALAIFGDIHAGGEDVRYDLVGRDIQIAKDHPLIYSLTVGDLADAFVWSQVAQGDMANLLEQWFYVRACLTALKDRLVGAVIGNHCLWYEGAGPIGYYHDFTKEFGVPLFDGTSSLKLRVGATDYNVAVSHAFPGHSIYNNAHPEMRAAREVQGADIYIAGHTHLKGISQQSVAMSGRDSLRQTFISTGTYKTSDSYARKKGYPPLTDEQMGAAYIILDPHEKSVLPVWNINSVVEILGQYLR